MTNDNLPPERPLSDQARAVRKADLMREISEEGHRSRRWLVPAAAAAAVVAAVTVGGAVLAGGDDPQTRTGVPAGSGPAAPSIDPDTPTQAPDDSATPSEAVVPSSAPSSLPWMAAGEGSYTTPLDGTDLPVEPPRPCSDLRIPLPGASEISSIRIGDTTVHLYANSTRWLVCDDWASLDGGDATIFRPHALGDSLGKAQLGISMNFSMDDSDVGEYVAGGALPDGVESITYTFADGHVEEAKIADGMWAMAYFADGTDSVEGATVDLGMADGTTQQVALAHPEDFCSQTNHGC